MKLWYKFWNEVVNYGKNGETWMIGVRMWFCVVHSSWDVQFWLKILKLWPRIMIGKSSIKLNCGLITAAWWWNKICWRLLAGKNMRVTATVVIIMKWICWAIAEDNKITPTFPNYWLMWWLSGSDEWQHIGSKHAHGCNMYVNWLIDTQVLKCRLGLSAF